MHDLTINGRRIGDDTDAYVIAEIGHNHGGSITEAEKLFRKAAEGGAHAAKLQKRDNASLFTKEMYDRPYSGPQSFGATYGEHRRALEFEHAEYRRLAPIARELGIDFFATAFDLPSVDFLADMDVPAIKIASGDLTNTPLLSYAAKSGRPLIVSTGGADMDDVRRACDTVLPLTGEMALLQCTAVYPAAPADLNLRVIETYRREFPGVTVGFSGHDLGPELSWIAYALGARVIEKHFTLDQSLPGSDHAFSLTPAELGALTAGLDRTRSAMGSPRKRRSGAEAAAVTKMGKKLVAATALPAGHVLTEGDVAVKSPGDGLPPFQLDQVLGRSLRTALTPDADIRFDDLAADR